ncbi:rab-GTPase-TBC domain-containing protein [Amylocarpus encephaloides]|uniref:Rab-GTPase-TBC domain-containing protein n=1 Tax=Amylocarpus encephaloides TaxID=45428 RepID=A0A9P7YU29_9HELO|nr:rab-GTPase-TBC domain-containing protein [Amylocarpus encephaloides]
MRSLEELRKRWQETRQHAASFEELKKAVKVDGDSSPCVSGLRSVCWKTFLLFQNTDVKGWSRSLKDSRSAYSALRDHLLRYIENPDELSSAVDPLDDDKSSPWNTMRMDEEIRAEIYQDVERCMPEEDYFRQPETQRILLDILFVFCKINQDVGYRQGMHEVLAPILWVVEQDAIDRHSYEHSLTSQSDEIMSEMLDPAYIEHDAFTLFSLIMRSAKTFYELGEPDRKTTTPTNPSTGSQQGASPIVERSKRIHEVYLGRLDPDLATHLTIIEILPQIFIIRWIRLLFGREFPFEELLTLWDTLLAEDPCLDLVDMICVAMLLRIRWQLIEANYSTALVLLLKYPAPIEPHGPRTFVDDAIFLRDNFSAVGGATIIRKYGAKALSLHSSNSRPSTPLGQGLSYRRQLSRTKSPLPSPTRFLQQQGGVEALFRGAAKGVMERGERLGINQAVRDAVGEVRQNMQGLQASRSNSVRKEGPRWSLDEGKSIPSSKTSISAMNTRNKQLARMLDRAMADLRTASVSEESNKEKCVEAMDLAIAKVDFVKVYLEDATMPLPPGSPPLVPSSPPPETSIPRKALPEISSQATSPGSVAPITPETEQENGPKRASTRLAPSRVLSSETRPAPKVYDKTSSTEEKSMDETVAQAALAARSNAPVPTRSSIAQSSFSWMLEPDPHSSSGSKSAPPKPPSPFLKTGRKPTSGPNREKSAFLFGEEPGESRMISSRGPLLGDADEGFHLGTIGGRDKVK